MNDGRPAASARLSGFAAPIGAWRARSILAVLIAMAAVVPACSRASRSPYADSGGPQSDRSPRLAEKLSQEAAELAERDPAGAEAMLREALAHDLYHGPAHNNLGVVYLKQGKLYEAAGEFEWAKKLLPGHPDPRMNLAMTLERAGHVDDAISGYRTALEVYPDHLPTMQALTSLELRAGRSDAQTRARLRAISLRGEGVWRAWALKQLASR